MNDTLLGTTNNIWYFSNRSAGFSFAVLMKSEKIEGFHVYHGIADSKGNPHIIIEKNKEINYFFWNGTKWKTGIKPILSRITKEFFLTITDQDCLQLFAIAKDEKKYIDHYFLSNTGWKKRSRLMSQGGFNKLQIEGVWCLQDNRIILVYSAISHQEMELILTIYDQNDWSVEGKVTLDNRGKVLNLFKEEKTIYVLLGKEELSGTVLLLCSFSVEEPYNCELKVLNSLTFWSGVPCFLRINKDTVLCWENQGCLYLAEIDLKRMSINNIRKENLFYPVEIMQTPQQMKLLANIGFIKIHGTDLPYPLIIESTKLELMIKGEQIRRRQEGLTDLNTFFRPVGYKYNQD